jgi:hypothetical protein
MLGIETDKFNVKDESRVGWDYLAKASGTCGSD